MGEIWWNVHPLAKFTHTHFPLTLGKLAPIFNPGLFFVYFRPFLIKISIIQIEKSVDGVLGIRTRGRRMVGVMIPLSYGSIGITKCYCLNNKTATNKTHPASPILSIRTYCGKLLSRTTQFMLMLSLLQPWSSLYKVESLGCKITSPFNKKIGCYERWSFYFYKQPRLLLNGEVIWQGSDSPLSKELHASTTYIGDLHLRVVFFLHLLFLYDNGISVFHCHEWQQHSSAEIMIPRPDSLFAFFVNLKAGQTARKRWNPISLFVNKVGWKSL